MYSTPSCSFHAKNRLQTRKLPAVRHAYRQKRLKFKSFGTTQIYYYLGNVYVATTTTTIATLMSSTKMTIRCYRITSLSFSACIGGPAPAEFPVLDMYGLSLASLTILFGASRPRVPFTLKRCFLDTSVQSLCSICSLRQMLSYEK